jgi:hypothetical protein
MIYLKLPQSGQLVNHKRVERLYALEKLQVRRRRRKKIPRLPSVSPWCVPEVPTRYGRWIFSLTVSPRVARSSAS